MPGRWDCDGLDLSWVAIGRSSSTKKGIDPVSNKSHLIDGQCMNVCPSDWDRWMGEWWVENEG